MGKYTIIGENHSLLCPSSDENEQPDPAVKIVVDRAKMNGKCEKEINIELNRGIKFDGVNNDHCHALLLNRKEEVTLQNLITIKKLVMESGPFAE
jgi:hypothetical protein